MLWERPANHQTRRGLLEPRVCRHSGRIDAVRMDVSPGTRLGPYEIVAPLGAGGMGEVYKARDTRLDRTVAIKVLPVALAPIPEFRERFEREARAISQLDHPHICALHDVGATGRARRILVMELSRGRDARGSAARGRFPLEQALPIRASQIAEALDARIARGIVHRDLKPGNIMLTQERARSCSTSASRKARPLRQSALPSRRCHEPAPLTAQGTILGTLQYMAPEQIEGAEADARSDIWAFGCVLYEMLTGGRRSTARLRRA